MRFFFPDSQDFVDETFDFGSETRSEARVRQRDDKYPHEIFAVAPYDGMLVSKAVVDGIGGGSGKYSAAQRQRFLRVGVREYFRLVHRPLATMGDCGAFTYVRETRPPYSAAEVADFYEDCGFDYGLSVDHVILSYRADLDGQFPGVDTVPEAWRSRQDLTLELAAEFLNYSQRKRYRFTPVGVAQGWSPASYAHAVDVLQRLGYRYIAFGGFVPLKTVDILACLKAASGVRKAQTEFHLLGITRCEHVAAFSAFGVVSFDSTSPLRKAFKDDKNNYYARERMYTALRVPQSDANPELLRRITAGEVKQDIARRLEQRCLQTLTAFDRGEATLDVCLECLREYERVFDGETDRTAVYRSVLEDRPWQKCRCEICQRIGIHVIIFRGAERNRRRGFHNLYVFNQDLRRHLGEMECAFVRHAEGDERQ
ncbi:MAG: queuine/other tRNA-ribosyltransferase [Candidatus Hydrogenedentes bacterium]|nr:queuine/other tRNA-ribosyltransferase [Candidatus Hydrogenedentota bacterium]